MTSLGGVAVVGVATARHGARMDWMGTGGIIGLALSVLSVAEADKGLPE